MVDDPKKDEVLKDLVAHLTWCLEQYESEPQPPVNWSPLRTLQNHLQHFCGNSDSGKAVGVAEILSFILDRMFSDLGTDTPWDDQGKIKHAWGNTQVEVRKLLKSYKEALESAANETETRLWRSFQDFIQAYNIILARINLHDFKSVKEHQTKDL
jgi:hypothetical protein